MQDKFNNPLFQVTFALKTFGENDVAKSLLMTFAKNVMSLEQADEIAYLLNEIKAYSESVEMLRRCLTLTSNPHQLYAIRANTAKMLNHLNKPQESIVLSDENLAINPNDYDARLEKAFSHYLMGDYKSSEEIMREISTHANLPDNVIGRVLYNIGSYDIEKGRFKQGLKGFVGIGHDIAIWQYREIEGMEQWRGESFEGTLYVMSEGGIGDEIINFRFAKKLVSQGMDVVWITHHQHLVDVFNRNGIKTVTDYPRGNDDDRYVLAMFLPIVMDLDKEDLWDGPYLSPSPEYVTKWQSKLPEGKKVGLRWSGNSMYEQDLHRSIDIGDLMSVNFGEATLVSLQKGDGEEKTPEGVLNVSSEIETIEDTLAIISLCDYVVTSCTSVAHMAGALGAKTYVCPPIAAYYVWLGLSGNKSDWYGENVTVIRQTEHKNWKTVTNKLQKLL